jgi:hypothetical protein
MGIRTKAAAPNSATGAIPPSSAATTAGTATTTRDRYVDALRVGSLVIVIVGHWLMADVSPSGEVGNALVSVPALQLLTWMLQVMPLFFLVGGVAHAYALASLERRWGRAGPGRYATFVGARASRLLRPTLVLVAVWIAVGLLARASGAVNTAEGPLLLIALRLGTQPLWFVGIYLGVAALAPAMLAAHRRWGAYVVVVLVLAAVTVDVVRLAAGLGALATFTTPLSGLPCTSSGSVGMTGCCGHGWRSPWFLERWWPSSHSSQSAHTRSRWSGCRARRSPTCRRRPWRCSRKAPHSSDSPCYFGSRSHECSLDRGHGRWSSRSVRWR